MNENINKITKMFSNDFENIFYISLEINIITYFYFKIFIINYQYFIFYYLQPLLIIFCIYYDQMYNKGVIRKYIINKNIKYREKYREIIIPQIISAFINSIQLSYYTKYGKYYRSFFYIILIIIYNNYLAMKENKDSQKIRYFFNFIYFMILNIM
jgi:hypothetical protein